MKRISKLLALLLVLTMILGVLAACGSDDGAGTQPSGTSEGGAPAASGGSESAGSSGGSETPAASGDSGSVGGESAGPKDYTLTVGMASANTTHDLKASVMRTQVRMIYEPLFQEDPETGTIVGKLAKSYEYIDDTTVRVELRDDIYFTDGQQMTAEDVVYSYRDIWAAGMRASYFVCYDWDNTTILDDFTIEFKFNQVYGPVVSYMIEWGIACADDYEGENPADADKWMSAPNGTGPYYCVENVAAAYVTYQRKDAADYWGELPVCEKATYRYYSELSTMYMDFETGALDVACGISSTDAQRVLGGECPSFTGYYVNPIKDVLTVVLPEETAVFDDVRVREAFFKSVDRENVAIAMYGPLYMEADSILPKAVKFYESQADSIPAYDPEGAKALLAEAGYPDGVSLRLIVTQDMQVLAEALQASLASGGFNISVESYDPPTAIPMLKNMESDFVCKQSDGGAYINEPGLLVDTLGPNSALIPCGMQADAWVEAFTQAQYTRGDESRSAGFAAMQEWAVGEYRMLPICERANMTVYNTDKLVSFEMKCADEPAAIYAVFR